MSCKALWNDGVLRIGDVLSEEYIRRLDGEGLLSLAQTREPQGETGGASREATDRHFACQFANSAARAVYVCIDPLDELEDVSSLIRHYFTDGRVLLIEVPCGSGAGALGLLSAIYEQRHARLLPTLPLCVDVLGGDFSQRGTEHFRSLIGQVKNSLKSQCVDVTFRSQDWNAMDIRSSSRLIDTAVEMSVSCDQVFLLVSNFSDALNDDRLREQFQHFLIQFTGRMAEPNSIFWIEPTSNKAQKILSVFDKILARLARWLRLSGGGLISGVRYRFYDPVTSSEIHSGVRVLKADHDGLL